MNVTLTLYTINDFLERGGLPLYAIFGIAVLLWVLFLERFLYLHLVSRKDQKRLVKEWNTTKSLADTEKIRAMFKNQFQQKQYEGLNVIKMLITVTPLFGLLGTVYGMMEIFDTIAQNGVAEAREMANGISRATLPTMSSMAIAIIGLFFQHRIEAIAKKKTLKFSDQLSRT